MVLFGCHKFYQTKLRGWGSKLSLLFLLSKNLTLIALGERGGGGPSWALYSLRWWPLAEVEVFKITLSPLSLYTCTFSRGWEIPSCDTSTLSDYLPLTEAVHVSFHHLQCLSFTMPSALIYKTNNIIIYL